MTDKVIITEKQANAINLWLSSHLDRTEEQLLNSHAENYVHEETGELTKWGSMYDSLNELSVSDLAKALYIGYKVEQKYSVGEWIIVFHDNGIWKCTAEITTIKNEYFTVDAKNVHEEDLHLSFDGWDAIRHATPSEIKQEKERRWWDKLGRKVGEWKTGDIFINTSGGSELYRPLMEVDGRTTITHGQHLKMVCPVEKRLDINE